MNKKIVLFDICGTLFKSNTTCDFLDYMFSTYNKYLFYKRVYTSFIWRCINAISKRIINIDLTRIIALRFLKGYNRSYLLTKVDSFYDKILIGKQNIVVLNYLHEYLKRSDCRVILLSATIDIVAEIIANKINCTEFYSTQLEYKDNDLCTGKIKRDLLGAKLNKINDLGIGGQIELFFTDDISDIPLLKYSKQKEIITNSIYKKKWVKIINKKKWEIDFIEV